MSPDASASAAAEYAGQFLDSPQVPAALSAMVKREATAGLTSTTSELGSFGVFDQGMVALLSAVSGFQAALPKMKPVPFNVAVPRELGAGVATGWVLPGAAIPAVKFFLASVRHEPVSIAGIYVLSDEVLRAPGSEAIITQMLMGALAKGLDTAFLDPASAGSDGVPASITNAAPFVTGTGAMAEDLASLVPLVTTQGTSLVWVARPTTLAAVAAGLGGASDLPRSILGISVVPAPFAPVGQLTLVDVGAMLVSVGDVDLSISDAAAIEMEGSPSGAIATGSPVAPVATQLVSLFQNNNVAFKVTRPVNWTAPSGCCAYYLLPTGSPA